MMAKDGTYESALSSADVGGEQVPRSSLSRIRAGIFLKQVEQILP